MLLRVMTSTGVDCLRVENDKRTAPEGAVLVVGLDKGEATQDVCVDSVGKCAYLTSSGASLFESYSFSFTHF